MSGKEVKPIVHRTSFVVMAAALATGMVALLTSGADPSELAGKVMADKATPAKSKAAAPQATEVRFGVIDPPVVMQQEFKELYVTSNTAKEGKSLECAGLSFVNGRLVMMSDRHDHCIFVSTLDLKTMRLSTPTAQVIEPNEQYLLQDAESITLRANEDGSVTGYIVCSQSNDRNEQPLPTRRHLARFRIPAGEQFIAGRATVLNGSPIREQLTASFEKLGIKPYRTYYADASVPDKNTYRWANIEGITFTPDGRRLIAGLRNPLTLGQTGQAIFAVIEHLDEAFDAGDAGRAKVTDVFTLDLGDRGVSDLTWDPMTKGYLIAAGRSNGPKLDKDQPFPPNTLDSALFWWSGRKSERPMLFATVPDMKIEAICRLGTSRFIAIGSDERDESESRDQRQSVLTVMDFTGFTKQ